MRLRPSEPLRLPMLQQPAEALYGTLPDLGGYLARLHPKLAASHKASETALCKEMAKRWHNIRLSYRKYEVTSKIGSAIIACTHFRAACLYSGLEGSTGRFGSGAAGFGARGE